MSPTAEIFRRLSQPLQPLDTGVALQLHPISGIRATLFDIYGTLIISGSGDIGTIDQHHRTAAMRQALQALSCPQATSAKAVEQDLAATIADHHERSKQQGIAYPEVDIVEVWQETFLKAGLEGVDPQRMAVEFEARANPTWPMPHMESCLENLMGRGNTLGLISNAQFFTPELFPALVGKSLEELSFDDRLRYYSFQHGEAKPSKQMYDHARTELAARGINPDEVLYVGNDMRNDIMPAAAVGFRTALFAGDRRSLRLREGDPTVGGIQPDAVVTSLAQIPEILN